MRTNLEAKMTKYLVLVVAFFVLIASVLTSSVSASITPNDLQGTVDELAKQIQDSQIQKTQSLDFFHWEEREGLYPSFVQLNFFGAPEYAMLRRDVQLFDNNMFVTTWIMEVLLECEALGTVSIDAAKLRKGIEAVIRNQDKNFQGAPVYIFWPQIDLNNTWIAWPTNLKWVVEENEDLAEYLQAFLVDIGLGDLWDDIEPTIDGIREMADSFKIPPDTDDTSCSLGLGSLLYQQRDKFSDIYATWTKSNHNISAVVSNLLKYAYKPFSSDSNHNTIDPRTYFFIHEYLYHLNSTAKNLQDIAFVTTWIMNIDSDRQEYAKQVAMPFNVNNVDLSVCSNVLFGLCSYVLTQSDNSWFSSDVQQLLLETAKLISWAIESGRVLQRPDIGLTYYPPIHDLYWFLSRTENLLRSTPNLPFPVLEEISTILTKVMQTNSTAQLLAGVKQSDNDAWWAEFLGQGDLSWFGDPEVHYDDRVFSTSVALNALLSTWTEQVSSANGSLQWLPHTPDSVRDVVKKGIHWLQTHIFDSSEELLNCFFSGSVKGMEQLPFAFPANRLEYINGTKLPPNPGPEYITSELIIGMQGVIPRAQYLAQLNTTHFDMPVPQQFTGFNQSFFPFWSSPDLTKAVCMLALSKHLRIVN